MNKVIESSWQSWLIALGLLIMIPVTVWLGVDFAAPKVDWNQYSKLRAAHFKECRQGRDEKTIDYEKCDADWQGSDAQKQHAAEMKNRSKFQVLVSSPLVLVLIVASNVINVAIISAAFVASAVMIHALYAVAPNTLGHAAWIMVYQLIMTIISLMLVLWSAYRFSKD